MRYQVTAKLGRKQVIEGIRTVQQGVVKKTEFVPVVVWPGRVFESDLDLSGWVKGAYLIELSDSPKAEPVKETPPVDDPPAADPPAVDPPEEEEEVEEEEEAEDPPAEDPPAEEEETEGDDYEEMDDGGYRCLHCGKEYKPGARSLGFIEDHIEKEHR